MCIDESQLYFDFDDYFDGESVCQKDLNFCAPQSMLIFYDNALKMTLKTAQTLPKSFA